MSASIRFCKQLTVASNGFWEKLTDLGAAASAGIVVTAGICHAIDRPGRKRFEKTMVAKLESIELMMAGKAAAAATATATAEKEAAA